MSLFVLGIVLATLTPRAQQTPSPNPDFVDALWVATSEGILKVATEEGTIVLEIPDAQDVRAIAVDEQRGVLWAYRQSTLQAYGFNGVLLLSVPVPVSEDDEGDDGDDDEEEDEEGEDDEEDEDGHALTRGHQSLLNNLG